MRKKIGGVFLIVFLFSLTPAFAETKVSGTISTNTTWTKAGSPYIVTGDISVNAMLTIEADVEVRFEKGKGITVGVYSNADYLNSIIAKGTQTSPVRFTSNLESPAPGDWAGIYFRSYTKEAVLEYCIIEYGGFEKGYNICAGSTDIVIKNCTVRNSSRSGIYLYNSSSDIGGEGCGNIISGNGTYGIYSEGSCSPVISHNSFSDNGSYPVRTSPNARIISNTYSGNGKQKIEVTEGTIDDDVTFRNEGGISTYVILGDIKVNGMLTVQAGSEIRFEKGRCISVGVYSNADYLNSVIAKGTQTSPVRFTSNADFPAPGDWKGIDFGIYTKESLLEYCTVEYGGFDDTPSIYIKNTNTVVQYSTIRYSKLTGIYITGGNPVIKCNTVEENQYGVYIKDVSTGLPPIINNNFLNNDKYGLYNEDTEDTVNAAGNWWNNIGGPGDDIFGNVTTAPYLTAKSDCTPLPEKTAYQQGYEAGRASCGIWDVDGDGKIGLAEAVYALQIVIGLRKSN